MDIDKTRPIVIALLCVLAIGLAAATLNSTVSTGGGSGIGGTDTGSGIGGDTQNRTAGNATNGSGFGNLAYQQCYAWLNDPQVILAAILALVVLAAILYRRMGSLGIMAFVPPIGVIGVLIHAYLTAGCASYPPDRGGSMTDPPDSPTSPFGEGGLGGLGGGTGTGQSTPSLILLAALGVVLIVALALLFKAMSGTQTEPEDEVDQPVTDEAAAAVGRAAGEAADRIEGNTDVENEVYRAWREMTQHLDVSNPASSTPGEFAVAATDAGLARDDVTELTELFERVRYGGEEPTGEREQRALDALRRIEREYAEGES